MNHSSSLCSLPIEFPRRRGGHGLLAVLAAISLTGFAAGQVAPASSSPPPESPSSGPLPSQTQVAGPGAGGTDEPAASTQSPVVLSTFNVYESSNVGYGAATTSSTARIVQDYVSLPQTVNVVTSELLTDFNLQDVRAALEYTSNMTFGLNDNPYNDRIRGAIVNTTYIDGVGMPGQYSAMPMDFFDRIEVVKGPSSVAFGLGQPGGLINYVSKMPQGIEQTTMDFGLGNDKNYVFRFDRQGVSSVDRKLSYRLVGFWDDGDYIQPNIQHKGAGAQLSLKYDFDKTSSLVLILAYSQTQYPLQGIENSIWASKTIYQAWQGTNLGASTYEYLPGTVFSNGSIFGVKGTLPPPGTQIGVLGTGDFVGVDSNANPPGWDGDTENTFRSTLIYTKDFADGHIHLRNALTLQFNQANQYDESPDGVLAIPGAGNTPITTGEPTVPVSLAGAPSAIISPSVGAPWFGISYLRNHEMINSSARQEEFDLVGEYDLPFGIHSETLVGTDFYDNESYSYGYQIPDVTADGGLYYSNLYSNSNSPIYIPTGPQTISTNNDVHSWGDGFYAQEQLNFFNDMVEAMAGWRIDYFDTETRNFISTSSFPGWVTTKGAPRFALTVKPTKWLSFYELYTKHADPTQSAPKYFLAQGTEWGPALQAQYPEGLLEYFQPGGYTVESGAKVSLLGGRIYASVAVFHEITTGQLNTIPAITVTNPDGSVTQLGLNQVQGLNAHGVEAEIFGQATDRLNFTLDYGNLHGNYPAFSNGVPDWLNPSATLSLHGKYEFGDLHRHTGFYATFGGEGFSPYWIYQGGNESTYYNSYQYVIDGGVGYRWRNGKFRESLYFNMDNITNQIVSIGTVTPWTVEPLRSWFLTYRVQF